MSQTTETRLQRARTSAFGKKRNRLTPGPEPLERRQLLSLGDTLKVVAQGAALHGTAPTQGRIDTLATNWTPANAFEVPGTAGTRTRLTFTLQEREAAYRNEVGLFLVDDARGRIGRLLPGDPGYARAALGRRVVLFPQGHKVGDIASTELTAGRHFGTYLVADSTSERWLARPQGRGRGAVYFSFARANADRFAHVLRSQDGRLAFEDLWAGGDRDYDDAVVRVRVGAPPDAVPPTVTIQQPASGTLTNRNVVVAGVVADDRSGVARVEMRIDGGAYSNVTFNAQGRFQITTALPTNGTADGSHVVEVRAIDRAGLASKPARVTFRLDTVAPVAPTLGLDPGSDSAPVGDGQTTFGTVKLAGVTEAGAAVALAGTGRTTTADAAGKFAFDAVPLALGANAFTVTATDAAGNARATTRTFTRVTVGLTPVVQASLARDTAPGGATNADGLTSDPTVSGVVLSDRTPVSLRASFDGSTPASFVDVSAALTPTGTFVLDRATLARVNGGSLPDGPYTLRILAEDDLGATSDVTVVTFHLDTAAPPAPAFDLDPATDSAPVGDGQTTFATVTLRGQTGPGALVALAGTTLSTTSDAQGAFTLPGVNLALGTNSLTLRATDAAGNVSTSTGSIVRFDTPPSLFADPDLEAAVRSALGLPANQAVTAAQLAGLKQLRADSNLVDSLAGLQYATNLETLELTPADYGVDGRLSDLLPLSGLANLTTVILVDAGLSDAEIAPLTRIGGLRSLDLRYNELTGIGSLATLPNLGNLLLHGNPLPDTLAVAGTALRTDLAPVNLAKATTIAEVATALRGQALELYRFVHDQIDFELYNSARKGPQVTLESRSGNDWDQASLLIQLLRASGVTARYVRGKSEISTADAMNWLGVKDPAIAKGLLEQIGRNPEDVSNGSGGLAGFRFDHVWVEADLIVPGEGVRAVPLDPSFKLRDYQPGLPGALRAVPFDEQAYYSRVQDGSTIDFYADQVASYLAASHPGMTLADVAYTGPIRPAAIDQVPTSPPLGVTQVYERFDTIPAAQKPRVQVLYLGIDWTFEYEEMLSQPITVGWTQAGSSSYYTPTLYAGATPVYHGGEYNYGDSAKVTYKVYGPGDDIADASSTANSIVGYPMAIGLYAGRTTPSFTQALTTQAINLTAALGENPGPAAIDGALRAQMAAAAAEYNAAREHDAETRRELCGYAASSSSYIATTFARPTMLRDQSTALAMPWYSEAMKIDVRAGSTPTQIQSDPKLFPIDGDASQNAQFLALGAYGSSHEHQVWEKLFNVPSLSTVKSIQLAHERGIPVWTISQANADLINLLNVDSSVKQDVRADVNKGFTVTIPRDPTPLGRWDGVGWITDYGSGSRIYWLNGRVGDAAGAGGASSGAAATPQGAPGGNNPNNTYKGDPVNIANGNVTRDETDIAIPNIGVPIAFARHYDSQSNADVGFGRGWTHTYGDNLTIPGDGSITWTNSVGYRLRFTPDGASGFTSPNTLFGRLRATGGGYEYRDRDGSVRAFDAQGRLVAIRDRNGNGLAVTREGDGRIASVSDLFDASRRLTFGYAGTRISTISDFTGRTWTFGYEGTGPLASVTTPGDATTPPAVTRYAYHEAAPVAGLLRQITEPNGGTASYTYYPNGRARSVTDAEGFTHSFAYDLYRNRTTFTDEQGNTTVYAYNDDGNLVEETHPDGATERYEWRDQLLRAHIDAFGVAETYDRYDEFGNLAQVTDRAGIVTTFTYDTEFGNLTSVTRPGGRVTTFRYDTRGNLEQIVDAEGNVTRLTRDARGLVRSRTAPRGVLTPQDGDYTTTFAYNAAGQVISATTDLPSTTIWDYDDRGNLETVTDPNGITTTYGHDVRDRLIRLTDATGKFGTYTYDAIGNQTSSTDRLGRTTRTEFDLRRLPVRITHPDGTISGFAYDAAMNMTTAVDEQGHATRLVHDENNRATWRIQADGGATRMRYDGGGRLVASVDPRGNATRYAYDMAGRLVTTTDALNHSVGYQYDTAGNLGTETDRLGRTTTYTYDRLDRVRKVEGPEGYLATRDFDANGNLEATATYDVKDLTQVPVDPRTLPAERQHVYTTSYDVVDRPTRRTNPRGDFTEVVYDAGGRVRFANDELRNPTEYAYDALNRLHVVTNARNETTTYDYDFEGNLKVVTNGLGQATRYTYDSRDRLLTEALDLGQTSRFAYDAAGNLVLSTDPLGNTTRFGYDAVNRPTSTLEPTGALTTWRYDLAGNLRELTDPAGNRTTYAYDALNRVETDTNQLGDSRTYTYDFEGNLATRTDRDGRVRRFWYNGLDQVEREEWLDGSGNPVYAATYAYDGFHRLETAGDPSSAYRYGYDELDRVTSVDNAGTPGSPAVRLAYGYDAASNRKSLDTTIGGVDSGREAWDYDELNRAKQVTQDGAGVTPKHVDFTYDRAGRPETITRYADLAGTAAVATTTYGFDRNGWLESLTHSRGTSPIAAYGFTRDDAGRVRRMTSPDGTSDYSYDGASQLTGVDNSTRPDEAYGYDAAGNRNTVGYDTGPANRLRSDGRYTYDYDREGNRSRRTETATGQVTTYAYDHRGRLVGVETRGSGDVVLLRAAYTYDVFDRRIGKSVDADGDGPAAPVVERFVHDGDAIALEFDGAGGLTNRYLNGPAVDQVLAAEDASGRVLWPLTDHLGTVRDLVDSAGTVAEHRVYDAFGNVVSRTGPGADHPFAFTGRELDAETGLHYYRSRYYDAAAGRFLGEDRIGFAAGDPNLYRYVGNSPTNYTDPDGYYPLFGSGMMSTGPANVASGSRSGEPASIGSGTMSQGPLSVAGQGTRGGGPANPFAGMTFGLTAGGLADAAIAQVINGMMPFGAYTDEILNWEAENIGFPIVQYGGPLIGAIAAHRAGALGKFLQGFALQFGIENLATFIAFEPLKEALKARFGVDDKTASRMANDIFTMAGILGGVAGAARTGGGAVPRTNDTIPPPKQTTSNSRPYVPVDPQTGQPIPLEQQRVQGVDIPLPDPMAGGRPHTVLGGRTGSDGNLYRQSATFPGETWPRVNGQEVPWSRVDWTDHRRPNVHPDPHQHIFTYDNTQRKWVDGPPVPFYW